MTNQIYIIYNKVNPIFLKKKKYNKIIEVEENMIELTNYSFIFFNLNLKKFLPIIPPIKYCQPHCNDLSNNISKI